jgi:site-specific DNA-methyltransferase (adenine-specific)
MAGLPDASVDMILCDLPYGTTACKWDSVIPFEPLWAQYRRIAKRNAAIVLTASQPFTTALIASNMRDFRYCWYWRKNKTTGHLNAKKAPLRAFEDVCVFYQTQPTYVPQMTKGKRHGTGGAAKVDTTQVYGAQSHIKPAKYSDEYYPNTELRFDVDYYPQHPTQKPVTLMEYMIRTYTHEGDVVLDNCMGSGTTGVACANTGRGFIGIERDDKYFAIASERIAAARAAVSP